MDLKLFDSTELANKGFDVKIVDPRTGDETEVVVTILGQDSDSYKAAQKKIQVKSLAIALKPGSNKEARIVEASDENAIALLVASTIGWKGLADGGKPYEFNKANAENVYRNFPVIREQVEAAQRERANFMTGK
jgi:hypothetical protein